MFSQTIQTLLIILCFSTGLSAQQVTASSIAPLDAAVNESSGLLYIENRLFTHNDSGDAASIYELDTLTGMVLRDIHVVNASNTDWEAMCSDSTYIYIGDFGNNDGARTNLKVWRIEISDCLSQDSVYADTIRFSYADQTDFTPSPLATNFDAEAFIAFGDSLYIFTKNWIDFKSNIYALPKSPGMHISHRVDSLDTQGLVSDAVYNPESDAFILIGYAFINPFIVVLEQAGTPYFNLENPQRFDLQVDGSKQVEGLAFINAIDYFISSEVNITGPAYLHRLHLNVPLAAYTTRAQTPVVYPNPASTTLHISAPRFANAQLYSPNGRLMIESSQPVLHLAGIPSGNYFLVVQLVGEKNRYTKRIHVVH
jgi:hypothetical protein